METSTLWLDKWFVGRACMMSSGEKHMTGGVVLCGCVIPAVRGWSCTAWSDKYMKTQNDDGIVDIEDSEGEEIEDNQEDYDQETMRDVDEKAECEKK